MNNIEKSAIEPVITLNFGKKEDDTFFVQMTVTGLTNEAQTMYTHDYIRRLFCGNEIGEIKQ